MHSKLCLRESQEPTIATVLTSCSAYMTAGHLKFVPNFLRIFPIFLLSSHFQRLSKCPLLHGNSTSPIFNDFVSFFYCLNLTTQGRIRVSGARSKIKDQFCLLQKTSILFSFLISSYPEWFCFCIQTAIHANHACLDFSHVV